MRLFVYGELCKADVLASIMGRVTTAELAVVDDYRRVRDPASGYFRAVPSPGGILAGMLLVGLDAADLDALDGFENVDGGDYRRVEVEVRLVASDTTSTAWLYV